MTRKWSRSGGRKFKSQTIVRGRSDHFQKGISSIHKTMTNCEQVNSFATLVLLSAPCIAILIFCLSLLSLTHFAYIYLFPSLPPLSFNISFSLYYNVPLCCFMHLGTICLSIISFWNSTFYLSLHFILSLFKCTYTSLGIIFLSVHLSLIRINLTLLFLFHFSLCLLFIFCP